MAETKVNTDTSDREIVLSRLLDATRERVFEAFTDPVQVGKWWGPQGFSTTTHGMDVREEGEWRFTMHGPDGTDYPNKIRYLEVKRPQRLVYRHSDDEGVESVAFHTTVTFEEEDRQTRLTMRMVFEDAAKRDQVVEEHDAIEGGKQTLARLAEHVERAR